MSARSRFFFMLSRPPFGVLALAAGLMLAALAGRAFGHGAYHERLAQLAAELEKNPTDARLHFELADLNGQHGDWQMSLLNLDRVEELAPGKYLTALLRGQAWLAGGQPAKAASNARAPFGLRPGVSGTPPQRCVMESPSSTISGFVTSLILRIASCRCHQS